MRPGRRLVSLALALLALAALGAAPRPRPPDASPTPTPQYEESLDVVATSVLVAPPSGVRRVSSPRDWTVRENGADRRVERVEPMSDEPWEVLVWVDGPLCRQASLARTVLAVAHQAETLVALGPVRVVVADPEPRTVLAPTREPRAVVEALARLAPAELCKQEPDALLWRARGFASAPTGAAAAVASARTPISSPQATPAGAAAAMHDLQALVERRTAAIAAGAGRCGGAACALLLVADGWPLDLDVRLPAALRPADSPQIAADLTQTTEGLARTLSVQRWLLFALPFAPPPPADEDDEADEPLPKDLRPGPAPFPEGNDHAPPGAPTFGGKQPRMAPPPRGYDVFTEPGLAPLRRLADLTAGGILRVPEQLPVALAALRERRWLWYRTAPFAPGEVRTLAVTVGREPHRAAAPAWVGAGGG